MAKRFITPFAEVGDRAEMPDTPTGSSSNYQTGYPSEYEEDPVVNPSTARFVERDKTNQLYNDITSNIKEWQETLFPEFIEATTNGGVPFAYGRGVVVTRAGVNYISVYDNNTDEPPNSSWNVYTGISINSIARSLNVPDSDVGYSTPGDIVKPYIYDESQQKSYYAPTESHGDTIVSLSGDALVTNIDTYTLRFKELQIVAPVLAERDIRKQVMYENGSLQYGLSDAVPLDDQQNNFRGLNSPDAWGYPDNIGTGSVSFGRNGASYAYLGSTFGHDCSTFGVASMAGGAGTGTGNPDDPDNGGSTGFGYCAFAWGKNSQAKGETSKAIGDNAFANSSFSTALGKECTADEGLASHPNSDGGAGIVSEGLYAIAMGRVARAYGDEAIAMGVSVSSYNGAQSFGSGINTGSPLVNSTPGAMCFGRNVDIPTIQLLPGPGSNGAFGSIGFNMEVPTERIEGMLKTGDNIAFTLQTTSPTPSKLSLGGLVAGVRRDIFSVEWNHPNAGQPFGVTELKQNEDVFALISENGECTFIQELRTNIGLDVNGTRVVGGQQGAISDAVGGDEVTKINEILAVLRSHGLIAT